MCVMCVGLDAETRPTRAELVTSCTANPDGFGWGVVFQGDSSRQIISGHSMDSETAIDSYFDALDALSDRVLGHLFHARIATRGAVALTGCHPFWTHDGSKSLLAHNGMLDLSIPKDDPRVDSQVFAEDVLTQFGGVAGLSEGYAWDILNGYVEGQRSKVVILNTVHESLPVIILGESLGHWDKQSGLWWSNYSYCTKTYTPTKYVGAGGWSDLGSPRIIDAYDTFNYTEGDLDDELELACVNPECATLLESTLLAEGFCDWCGWCQDCTANWTDCMCMVTQ